jgi:glyoxylase-like metal-dependent hydrolase (beta-lactamase superfamily II)
LIFSLDVRRARKGDCLLLHFGSGDEPGIVMIDGGPASVYGKYLHPRLAAIKEARGLGTGDPLPVDLLMVSHVDDDHIRGILDLTRELTASPHAPLLRIFSFWHNSFDDIIGNEPRELTAALAAQFGAASLSGELPAEATLDSDEEAEVVRDSLKVLAGVEQGHRLRGDVKKLEIPLNPEFDGKLILAGEDPLEIGAGGLTFTVAGPAQAELKKLQEEHDKWLEGRKEGEDAEAALAAYVDKSVPNLSSIVVLARSEDKSMLLTGDARGDKILEGLEAVGVLQPGATMDVDILKVPHHGSSNNLNPDFFRRIAARHYVFSGNGEHGNPERESMAMLFGARGEEPFEIHLTYPVDEIDVERRKDWEKEQAKEKAKAAKGGKKEPRENWNASKHSLAAFFEETKLAEGQKLHIADEARHVIDLLDPLRV